MNIACKRPYSFSTILLFVINVLSLSIKGLKKSSCGLMYATSYLALSFIGLLYCLDTLISTTCGLIHSVGGLILSTCGLMLSACGKH